MTRPPDVLIAGAGALASLFAARLAAAGADVLLLDAWGEAIEVFNRQGVTLRLPDGSWQSCPVRATSDPAEAAGAPLALVLVKGWQTAAVAGQLQQCLAPGGLAVSLQNGLGNLETLAAALGERRAAAGITTLGACLLGPADVRLAGDGPVSLDAAAWAHPGLREWLARAGMSVLPAADLRSLQWSKLVVSAAINPLSALLGVPNGELLARPHARRLLAALAAETAAVAQAQGITLPYADPAAVVEEVARRTGANYSSMLQDVRRAAPTEIDQINGAVVQAAQALGLPAPLNETAWLLVRALAPQPDAYSLRS